MLDLWTVNNACNKNTTSRKKHNTERKISTKRVDEDMVVHLRGPSWFFIVGDLRRRTHSASDVDAVDGFRCHQC